MGTLDINNKLSPPQPQNLQPIHTQHPYHTTACYYPNPYQSSTHDLLQMHIGEPAQPNLSAASSRASLRLSLCVDTTAYSAASAAASAAAAACASNSATAPPPSSAIATAPAHRLDSSSIGQHQSTTQHSEGQQFIPHQHHPHGQPPPPLRHQSAIATTSSTESPPASAAADSSTSKAIKRNSSLISFKSIDCTLKSIYSGMRRQSSRSRDGTAGGTGTGTGSSATSSSRGRDASLSGLPYVRVETVDGSGGGGPADATDSTETLLLQHYQQRHGHQQPRRSFDRSPCGSHHYLMAPGTGSRSLATSPGVRSMASGSGVLGAGGGGGFLTVTQPPNVRRSSTSDICDSRQHLGPSAVASSSHQQHHPHYRGVPGPAQLLVDPTVAAAGRERRPSTSDLLRRARERKGGHPGATDAGPGKMGRSVSQGGLPRGGRGGGRRTSIAF